MTVIPYLHFEGQAEEALNFYKNIFNGEIGMTSRYGDASCPSQEPAYQRLPSSRTWNASVQCALGPGAVGA